MTPEAIDNAQRDLVAQPLQRGTQQGRTADAVIEKACLVIEDTAVVRDAPAQFGHLRGDGVSDGLLLGRNTGIQRNT
jgi:hypothetical protein